MPNTVIDGTTVSPSESFASTNWLDDISAVKRTQGETILETNLDLLLNVCRGTIELFNSKVNTLNLLCKPKINKARQTGRRPSNTSLLDSVYQKAMHIIIEITDNCEKYKKKY